MGFAERIKIAAEFEHQVEHWLQSDPRIDCVARNGTEHTHPDFANSLRSNAKPASLFVRFAPDGVYLKDGNVVHWEAKCGKNIEKHAYENYIRYTEIGCDVELFVKVNADAYRQNVKSIEFVDSDSIVSRYPENRRHPVIDGWITPRAGHGYSGSGSGTAYREIDVRSLVKING